MRVAGFGFNSAATRESLDDVIAQAGGLHGFDAMASAEDKVATPILRKLSIDLELPLKSIRMTDVAEAPVGQSAFSPARYGGRRLAEACALICAGPGGRLVGERLVSADGTATLAIAEGPDA